MKKRIALLMVLAMVLAMSGGALAAEGDGSTTGGVGATPVKFKLSNTQISATVPTTMSVVVNADGSLTYPTASKIENTSVFPIRVKSIAAAANTNWALASADDSTTANQIVSKIKPGASDSTKTALDVNVGELGSLASKAEWNMTAADATTGSGTDSILLSFTGNVHRLSNALTTSDSATVYTITFTLESGAYTTE